MNSLSSLLAWERAPALPISKRFTPELVHPRLDDLSDVEVRVLLRNTIERLYSQRIVLEMTEHLSDRQLYCLISRDILPSYEKKIDHPRNYLHWHCLDDNDTDSFLRYYATDERGEPRQAENQGELPPMEHSPILVSCPAAQANLRTLACSSVLRRIHLSLAYHSSFSLVPGLPPGNECFRAGNEQKVMYLLGGLGEG